jgi:hypothetical protein
MLLAQVLLQFCHLDLAVLPIEDILLELLPLAPLVLHHFLLDL